MRFSIQTDRRYSALLFSYSSWSCFEQTIPQFDTANVDNYGPQNAFQLNAYTTMLSIICHVTSIDGRVRRYTVKIQEDTTVQALADRIQQRFNDPLTKIQRNCIHGPAEVLFMDEKIEENEEFFFSFEQQIHSEQPLNNLDYEMPTFDQMPQLAVQPLPPSSEGSPSQTSLQLNQGEVRSEMPASGNEQIIVPLTQALLQINIETVIKGSIKAEQIVEKLKRNESIEPGERQLLVRVAGRWLMDCCLTRFKPTSAERAFFAREFFGKLPNFKYDIKDFHNSQSRGFLDVFIYNERDRKTRSGELNRHNINSDTFVKSMKRKYNRISEKDEHNPFLNLAVPLEVVTTLTRLDFDEQAFESRYIDLVSKEFGNLEVANHLAHNWEESVAPKILRYVKKINPDIYQRTVGSQELSLNVVSNCALKMVPFLVRRLHRENSNTKITYLIAKVEPVDDEHILKHMRQCNDAGPFIATDEHNYLLVISDKVLACEQSSSMALEKLVKSYFVYSLANSLSQLRKAMITLLLLCFGLTKTSSSSFKEVCQCIMSID